MGEGRGRRGSPPRRSPAAAANGAGPRRGRRAFSGGAGGEPTTRGTGTAEEDRRVLLVVVLSLPASRGEQPAPLPLCVSVCARIRHQFQ